MKHHTLYNKIVYCYDVAIYFPARILRTYLCVTLSVHYLSSCAVYPLSWQIFIIPTATKKTIYIYIYIHILSSCLAQRPYYVIYVITVSKELYRKP